jgi:hypothetical protein
MKTIKQMAKMPIKQVEAEMNAIAAKYGEATREEMVRKLIDFVHGKKAVAL